MNRLLRSMLLVAVIGAGIRAYIDPGSAGFIIVTVLGFLAAIGYTVRAYLSRLRRLVFRGGQTAPEGEAPDQPDA